MTLEIFLVLALLTAVLVVLPVAISTAIQLDVKPRSLAVLVALSASLSFITPFEPACLLVYGPGGHRFSDFVKSGLHSSPLAALTESILRKSDR
jgi:di/tricarboxylate transporter